VMMIALVYGLFGWIVHSGASSRVRSGMMVLLILFDLNGFENLLKNRQEVDRAGGSQLERLISLRGAAQFFHSRHEPFRAETAGGVPDLGDAFRVATDGGSDIVSPELRNVRYRVAPGGSAMPGAVYADPFWKIYEKPGAYPRAWLVHQTVYERSKEGQLARLRSPGFDPRRTVALDGLVSVQPAAANAPDSIDFQRVAGGRMELEAAAAHQAVMVLSERYSAGWRATVDGNRVPLYRADGELQAIVLPAGSHQVTLEFAPRAFYLGAMLTLAGLLGPLISWFRV
jgi:hypothetical protein